MSDGLTEAFVRVRARGWPTPRDEWSPCAASRGFSHDVRVRRARPKALEFDAGFREMFGEEVVLMA